MPDDVSSREAHTNMLIFGSLFPLGACIYRSLIRLTSRYLIAVPWFAVSALGGKELVWELKDKGWKCGRGLLITCPKPANASWDSG